MSKLSTTKGKAFERAIAAQLREWLPKATIHRSSQADRAYAGDVVIGGDAPELAKRLWLELNDARSPQPLKKLAQAERDVAAAHDGLEPYLPVVVWHKLGSRSIKATMRLGTLLELKGLDEYSEMQIVVTVDWDELLAKSLLVDWRRPPAANPVDVEKVNALLRKVYPALATHPVDADGNLLAGGSTGFGLADMSQPYGLHRPNVGLGTPGDDPEDLP